MSGWYFKRENGEVVGLYSEDEIKSCAARGGIGLETLVMHEETTDGEWVAASRVAGLRMRIEASAATSSTAEAKRIRGYVPARLGWASRAGAVQRALGEIRDRIVRVSAEINGDSAQPTAHVCENCRGEFVRYQVPGQCPLCGQWITVTCGICGFSAGAYRFLESKWQCPRCDAKIAVPGAASIRWRFVVLLSLVGLMGMVTVMAALAVRGLLTALPTRVVSSGVEIVALLPDPPGEDIDHEQVTIANLTERAVNLSGWQLQDRAGKGFLLSGAIPGGAQRVVTLAMSPMSLDNRGDTILLIDAKGVARSKVVYRANQVQPGTVLNFATRAMP